MLDTNENHRRLHVPAVDNDSMQEPSGAADPRFGPDFVEQQRARYGRRPPEQRQLTYDIAVGNEYAPWRAWLDEQLAQLEPAQAEAQAGRVWLDEGFWTVIFELAVGAHPAPTCGHLGFRSSTSGRWAG